MKAAVAGVLFAALAPAARAAQANPLGTVLSLLNELEAKIIKEGEAEQKAYEEFVEWCDDTAKNGEHTVQTETTQKGKLEAKIGELTSDIEVSESKIDELAGTIAQAQSELKNATLIREKEVGEFKASEGELVDAIDTLSRAIGLLEKEMAKNPAALAQVDTKNMQGALQALSAVLDAAAFPSTDQKKLAALVQARQGDDADDLEFGAPAAATYKTHSGGILDVLEDMKEKAEGELADLRKAEVNSKHNYEMLKQSLTDQANADGKDMADEKASKAASEESKAIAEGDLKETIKALDLATKALDTSRTSCMQTAADHEATVAARTEELKVIAEAEKILKETSSGAVSQTYAFSQVDSSVRVGTTMRSGADLARLEVVALVKRLARQQHSAALAQLASRIAAVARYGAASGEDPFGKVKGLISDMIAKLEREMSDEASEKEYCDEQMSKTEAKKAELEEDVAKLSSKIDQAAAKSAQLKEEIAELQSSLSALAKKQAEMDKLRSETHAEAETAKADLTLGLSGVRKALQVLRDYYGAGSAALVQDEAKFGAFMQQPAPPQKHSSAAGAGQSIIGILEVCESDFAKNLAKEEAEEDDAQDEYDKISQENALSRTNMEQDVKYKSQESKSLDKTASELSSDRETTNSELSAVLEYYAKIKDRCIAKPETYETRKARREAEIQGLKEALATLENETALLQRKRRGGLRGTALLAR